jgi:hypothetical protein
MLTPEPYPPWAANEDVPMWPFGLPVIDTVNLRNRVRRVLAAGLPSAPGLHWEVNAGYRSILIFLWPTALVDIAILDTISILVEPYAHEEESFRLFLSEQDPCEY